MIQFYLQLLIQQLAGMEYIFTIDIVMRILQSLIIVLLIMLTELLMIIVHIYMEEDSQFIEHIILGFQIPEYHLHKL